MSVDGIKSVDALLSAIIASKNAELWRVIHGICIEGVGARSANQHAAEMSSLRDLANADVERLQRVDGIRRATAENVTAFFATREARALVAALAGDEAAFAQVPAN